MALSIATAIVSLTSVIPYYLALGLLAGALYLPLRVALPTTRLRAFFYSAAYAALFVFHSANSDRNSFPISFSLHYNGSIGPTIVDDPHRDTFAVFGSRSLLTPMRAALDRLPRPDSIFPSSATPRFIWSDDRETLLVTLSLPETHYPAWCVGSEVPFALLDRVSGRTLARIDAEAGKEFIEVTNRHGPFAEPINWRLSSRIVGGKWTCHHSDVLEAQDVIRKPDPAQRENCTSGQ